MTAVANARLENAPTPASSSDDRALRQRVLDLLRREIGFIPNREFAAAGLEDEEGIVEATLSESPTSAPADLPAHLRRMCETDLLTPEQERALFREMNQLKFRANALRSRLDPERAAWADVRAIDSLLARAQSIRDEIIKANMRLVMSIVKKFVTPQHSFDEILSEGAVTLMQAVEKFDFERGFRFSTYAYRSIARTAYRFVTTAQKDASRFADNAEQWVLEQEDDRSSSSMTDLVWDKLRELTGGMLDQLDRRERFIVRSRYALGSHRRVRTFQCLADKLGVSKERVRQLEQRAVAKLRAMAAKVELDDLFGAAMA